MDKEPTLEFFKDQYFQELKTRQEYPDEILPQHLSFKLIDIVAKLTRRGFSPPEVGSSVSSKAPGSDWQDAVDVYLKKEDIIEVEVNQRRVRGRACVIQQLLTD